MPDWVAEESSMTLVVRRAIARGLRHPVQLLVVTAVLTGASIFYRAAQRPSYEVSFHFRVVETALATPGAAPRPPGAIRDYLANVVFSDTRLEQLMRKYHYSLDWLRRDRIGAIRDFREELTVDVSRNFLLYNRRPGDPPRSAHLVLALSGSDPEATRAMLEDLTKLIVQQQMEERAGTLRAAAETLQSELTRARDRARSLRHELVRTSVDAMDAVGHRATALAAKLSALRFATEKADAQVLALEHRLGDVALTENVEREQLALRFERFDEAVTVSARPLTGVRLLGTSVAVFALVAMIVLPVVGGFDAHVHATEDLTAIGLPVLGSVRRFPGDDLVVRSANARARSKP